MTGSLRDLPVLDAAEVARCGEYADLADAIAHAHRDLPPARSGRMVLSAEQAPVPVRDHRFLVLGSWQPGQAFAAKLLTVVSIGLIMPQDGPVVWRAPMAMKALFQFLTNVQWGDLDYLFDRPSTGNRRCPAHHRPAGSAPRIHRGHDAPGVALNVARKGLQMFQQVKVPILGVVENMSGFVCTNCGTEHLVFKKEGERAMAKESGTAFLGRIPLETDIITGGDAGEPLLVRSPNAPAAQSILDLARAFEHEVARVNGAFANPTSSTSAPQLCST